MLFRSKVSTFIPSHITGFFSIKNDQDPLRKGSCGAGVLINNGVKTTVESLKDENTTKNNINIIINNKKDLKNEKISLKTIEAIENNFNLELKNDLIINHEISVPIGSGFGTSASCALGTAIGLFKLFKPKISKNDAMQMAHFAEVNLGSGLGDVLSQTSKGIVIRESPGAPGIGKTLPLKEKNNFSDFVVLTKTYGQIDTSTIIEDPIKKRKINKIGIVMQEKIEKNPTLENFMNCSYEFAKDTGLINRELLNIVDQLKKCTIGSSMAMLGNTVFAITKEENLSKIDESGDFKVEDFKISKIYNDNI